MNTFGTIFRIHIWGESHQAAVGIVIDGCPSGLAVEDEDFKIDLNRRKSGTKGTTKRKESDIPEILSGIHNGYTTGSPISISFKNNDCRSKDYDFRKHPRPGHADFTADKKFDGFNDDRGGGHFSGRLTTGLVAAGVIAKKIIPQVYVNAILMTVGGSADISATIDKAIAVNDSVGGIIKCTAKGVSIGLGEPFFQSVESLLSQAVFSIPGVKGIEFGNGFESAKMYGSENNDRIVSPDGTTNTNNCGGINGGITNGNNIVFKVAVKPTSSISKVQKTYNYSENEVSDLQIKGRHDACIALRMPVIIEAVTAIVLADLTLRLKKI